VLLERCFGLARSGATVGGEVRGGLTTFMVMAYIIFVNPAILGFAGIPARFVAWPDFSSLGAGFDLSIFARVGVLTAIGAGFVAYCAIKLLRGKGAEVHGMMYGAAAAFLIYFALPAIRPLLRI
jgi:AGZA family xanthine/uracil permease-like MFS transporter